ncbi:MAG: endo-1,3-alpha-glucanase family glycosylhydrolase [Chloroflexota bacterium]
MKLIVKLSSMLFVFLLLVNTYGSTTAQEGPLALAFYYAWYDQNTWSSGQSVDLPAEPYTSADRATIERHVTQAQSAGLDGLVQAWYGPQETNNQTETNFRILLDAAAARGFKAAVDVEVASPFLGDAGAVTNALQTLLATHARHPAYLRYQGKPLIFFWQQQRFSVAEWATIRQQVDPDQSTYWIAEGVDLGYQAVFDGHHLYSIAWAGSPADQLAKWAGRVREYAAANQVKRLWVATAMPGYDDTRLPRAEAFTVPRRDGDYYRETWQAAVSTGPDILIVNSFNEWPEGSHLEPSATYGNLYLELTRELITTWRGSPPPAPAPAELAQQLQLTPVGPYIKTESLTNVRRGPGTSFERVGSLTAGSQAAVLGQTASGDWWLIDFQAAPEGQAWVSAEVVEFVGEASAVPVAEAPAMEATAALTATVELDPDSPRPGGTVTTAGPTIKVPAGGVNVRRGPGLKYDLLGRLEENTSAVVVAQNESRDWWQIEYEAGENGLAWVAAALADLAGDRDAVPVITATGQAERAMPVATSTPTPAAPVIAGSIEATDPVNVRAEPSVDGELVGGLYPGELADVLAISQDGEWWQIEFADGPEGAAWVATEFVRFQGDKMAVSIFGLGTPTPTPGPTDTPTPTPPLPTPTPLRWPPTFAPTATSLYQATSAALLSGRGTPDPAVTTLPSERRSSFQWSDLPWGILSGLLVAAVFWYQFSQRRRKNFSGPDSKL